MIEIVLAQQDLARLRFAHSELRELVASLRALRDPAARQMYQSWRSAVYRRLGGVDMELLTALAPVGRLMYDFLFPPILTQMPELDAELDTVGATPPEAVRYELEMINRGRPLPRPLQPLYDDPGSYLPYVIDQLREYWRVAGEPVRSQIRSIVTADVFHRTDQFAAGGVANVLSQLHPEVSFQQASLYINKPHHCTHLNNLTGLGVVLVPCAFAWPSLIVICCDAKYPSLIYPPRGVAGIGIPNTTPEGDPQALLGRTRINLLVSLKHPKTTTELAQELSLSPAAVSQHLKVLKEARMAVARRQGRMVLYQRTNAGTVLLSALLPPAGAVKLADHANQRSAA